MTILFLILIILASLVLGFIILVQNPKGGGLSGSIAGFNNQFMGVKQTTDVLEKGTWIFAAIIAILCIVSTIFLKGAAPAGTTDTKILQEVNPNVNRTAPANQQPATNPNTVPLQPKKK
ncbi:MAG: protein-export rane protein [Chitinophagaceae bacterium]|nr:protein-export rane protein [Chitinophagaceae bacterium]